MMVWVIQNSEDNTQFDLYIGVKDGIITDYVWHVCEY